MATGISGSSIFLGNGLIFALWIVLNQMQFINSFKRPDYVSEEVINIDDRIGANLGETCSSRDRTFYIEFDVTDLTDEAEIYFCYLSHFDGKYVQENGIQIMKPFQFNNTRYDSEDSILGYCQYKRTKEEYGQNSADEDLKALHGVKFTKNGTKLEVSNSFSNESFSFDLKEVPSNKLRIKFGDFGKNSLFSELIDGDSGKQIKAGGMKVPPPKAISSVHKMLQAFLVNPCIWMIPFDMAFVREENGKKSRRFHLAIKNAKEIKTKFGYKNEENEIKYMKIVSNVLQNGTIKPGTEKPDSKLFCTTKEIFVKPAIIRDRFIELLNTTDCDDEEDQTKCPFSEEIDYAVRVGCLDGCDKIQNCSWINELFLDAFSDWIESKDGKSLKQWSSKKMDLTEFRRKKQPIDLIENGKYIYFPVPKEWIQTGVKMLAHDCGDYGIFVSAFKNEAMKDNENNKIGPIYDWEKDFEFLEDCTFHSQTIHTETYNIGEKKRLNLNNVPIGFGTYNITEINGKKKQIPAKIGEEQILRIKFKYDMNDDSDKFMRRDNKFVIEEQYIIERNRYLGHYFLPIDMMFEEFNVGEFDVFGFNEITPQLQDSTVINKNFFGETEVMATIYRVVLECRDFKIYTTRMWSEQEVTYRVPGKLEKETSTNYLETRIYQYNNGIIYQLEGLEGCVVNSKDFGYNPFLYNYVCQTEV